MPHFLVLQLKAPLASFGSTLGAFRGSDLRPRRSAVLGLVTAAMGITHTETARFSQLSRQVRMAVVTVREPTVMVDYHTVQAPFELKGVTRREQLESGPPNCEPTRREYLQNGHWLVALEGPQDVLTEMAQALEFPVFPLYLGRLCCPLSAYTAPLVLETEVVEQAVSEWVKARAMALPSKPAFFWDEGTAVQAQAELRHVRNDQRLALDSLFFAPRVELEGTFC